MPIKELEDQRRFSIAGKVHIGVRYCKPCNLITPTDSEKCPKCGKYTPPRKIDYFRFDPKEQDPKRRETLLETIKELFGARPQSLPIAFPDENQEHVFPYYYCCYGGGGLKCQGDGETVIQRLADDPPRRWIKGIPCPTPKLCDYAMARGRNGQPGCKPCGKLRFFLPQLPGIQVWELDTGSYNSIIQINSAFDIMRAVCGKISMVQVELVVRPRKAHTDDNKQVTIYALDVIVPESLERAFEIKRLGYDAQQAIAQLPAPSMEERPALITPEADESPDADGVIGEVEDPTSGEVEEHEVVVRESAPPPPLSAGGLESDPEVLAALEGVPPFKAKALLGSVQANGWGKAELLTAIRAVAGRKPEVVEAKAAPVQEEAPAAAAPAPTVGPASTTPAPQSPTPPAAEKKRNPDDDLF